MNRSELCARVAARSSLPKADAVAALSALTSTLADVLAASNRDEDALGHVGVVVAVFAGAREVPSVDRGGTQVAAAGDEGAAARPASFAGVVSIRLPECGPSGLRCTQQDQPAEQRDRTASEIGGHLFAAYRWKIEQGKGIFDYG